MMQMRVTALLFVFAMMLALPSLALAHTVGASWNIPYQGGYTVDIGYDPTTFVAGTYTRFDFLLWKGPANTGDPVDYAQIWIRITRSGNNTVLATGIWKQPIGPTTLLYEFQDPGNYTLEASYRDKDGNDIAIASIPITVAAASGGSSYGLLILSFVCGALFGAFLLFSIRRR